MNREDFQKAYGRVVVRAWSEASFKKELMADPARVLGEHGIDTPKGMDIKIVENNDKQTHFVLPSKPGLDCYRHWP